MKTNLIVLLGLCLALAGCALINTPRVHYQFVPMCPGCLAHIESGIPVIDSQSVFVYEDKRGEDLMQAGTSQNTSLPMPTFSPLSIPALVP